MPGNDSVKINKYITFKDNDKFIEIITTLVILNLLRRMMQLFIFQDTMTKNIHIKDYLIDGKKITDLGRVGSNEIV